MRSWDCTNLTWIFSCFLGLAFIKELNEEENKKKKKGLVDVAGVAEEKGGAAAIKGRRL